MKFFSPRAISISCRFGGRNLLDPLRTVFSANSLVALMMAVYIAFQLDLQRPYWAMLTVYLTTQPVAGALRSKALFRVVGTGLGASSAVILVPAFVNEPPLQSLAIAGWSGFCLYVSLLDRTPRSYMFVLAGHTVTTIAFSSVTTPDAKFTIALARVEEITLGIACAMMVHDVLFPQDLSSVPKARVTKSVRDAGNWMADTLLNYGTKANNRDQMRLASDMTEFEMLSTQNRLATVLPLLREVEARLAALGAAHVPMSERDDLPRATADWARDPHAPQDRAERLQSVRGEHRKNQPRYESRNSKSKVRILRFAG